MPANLTPDYLAADERFKKATTSEEKIECLREMIRVIPKHKGTDRLQADLKRRLAKLLKGDAAKKKVTGRVPGEFVDHEGLKQVLLLGAPNAGKSSLVCAVSEAHLDVAPYPYTTTRLAPGMMRFEDIQIQLVDSPAISREFARSWMGNQIRSSDLVLWVVSLGDDDLLTTAEETREVLAEWHFDLVPTANVTPPEEVAGQVLALPTLLVATHADDPEAVVREELLLETIGPDWVPLRVSSTTGGGLDELRSRVFEVLEIVRVYTKQPGKKADPTSPYVLDAGSTVLDLAEAVHKDIATGLKFARIWGRDAYDGQHVQRDHVLSDGDIVELHA